MVDSLVVDIEVLGRPSFMPLFVVLQPGLTLDAPLTGLVPREGGWHVVRGFFGKALAPAFSERCASSTQSASALPSAMIEAIKKCSG